MTLSVTIERYFAIWYPLKRLRLKTPLMVVSVVFSFLYNIPRFLEFETTTTNMTYVDEDINITQNKLVTIFKHTDLRINRIYVNVYVVWMKFFVVEIIPYVVILVLNALIIIKIRQSVEVRKVMTNGVRCTNSVRISPTNGNCNHQSQQSKERNMAVVLICIVIMFITCQSLKIIPDVYEAVFCNHDENVCNSTTAIEVLISVSHLFLAINSAFNFIIYMFRGDRFRHVFWKIFILRQWTRERRRSLQPAGSIPMARLTVTTTQIKHNPNSSIEDPSQLLTVEEITLEN